jgi:hypothetical protein
MSTNTTGIQWNRQDGIDISDFILGWFVPIGVISLVGIGDLSILGYSTSEVLFSGSGIEITIGWLVVIGGFAGAWLTNRIGQSWDDMEMVEQVAAGGSAVLIVGIPLVPALGDLVTGSDAIGVGAGMVLGAGYALIAYY